MINRYAPLGHLLFLSWGSVNVACEFLKQYDQKPEGDFSGDPVADLSASQCRGYGFDPWFGKIPHAVIRALQLLKPAGSRAQAPQQEKPSQREACVP